jgi:hypothetical protein
MMGSDHYSGSPFRRFIDRLVIAGLESFGLYYGNYRAIVVDNSDSNNQGKLIIRCPAVGDTKEIRRTAYPKAPSAGSGHGFRVIPPKDSFVWVSFENGKLDMPIWEGSWWCKDQLPEDWKDNVEAGGLISPGGHQFFFNDKSGEKEVRIRHSGGATIRIDNDGNIEITNSSGKTVYVGSDASEAAVLGDTLKGLLDELIDAIAALTVPTSVGPSGTPVNVAQFQAIKARWQRFLSTTVKVA